MNEKSAPKVLIITRFFVPYFPSLGGVIRILTLANYLSSKDINVNILSGDGEFHGYFGFDINKLNIQFLHTQQKKLGGLLKKNASFLSKLLKTGIRLIRACLLELKIADEHERYFSLFFEAATKIIDEQQIANVILSTPPHSMQKIGYKIKRKYKGRINLIVDYRDSWNNSKIFRKRTIIGRIISTMLERRVLKSCDYFTYVSTPIIDKIINNYKIDITHKSKLIMNGFTDNIISNSTLTAKASTDKKIVGYFGHISDNSKSYRSVKKLLEILEEDKYLDEHFEFHFYGSVIFNSPLIKGLKSIYIHDKLEHSDVSNKMKEMDYLLIVHSDSGSSDEVITGKIFEYISVKKPILCLAPKNMEGGKLVEKYRMGLHVDINRHDEMVKGLYSVLSMNTERFYSNVDIKQFSREIQYTGFLELLK